MKKLLALTILLVITQGLQAQYQQDSTTEEKERKFDPNRLVFGGIIGASFGNITFVQVSPQVGYMFNQYLTAGAGINFIYSSQKFRDFAGNEVYRFNSGFAGMNVFARVFPIRILMISAQPELNYSWGNVKYAQGSQPTRSMDGKFVPSLLVGGGIVIPAGGRGGMMVSLQYDVLQNERSPYGSNAFVNIGFTF
jgi:hypothetical protein